MFVSLIDAELASLTSDMRRTEQLYDLAIDQAKRGQWGFETNIMYELAGDYYIRCGARHVGALLIDKAVAGYRHQGCYGKATQLEQLHAGSREPSTISRSIQVQTETHVVSPRRDSFGDISLSEPYSVDVSSSAQSPEETLLTLDVVDLASILKSSQIISSEMNYDLLMGQMLGVSIYFKRYEQEAKRKNEKKGG